MVVRVDFNQFHGGFLGCPAWWRNFIMSLRESEYSWADTDGIVAALKTQNVIIVHREDMNDIEYIEFEDETARGEFILFWTLYGGK